MSYVNITIDSGLYSADYEYRVNPNQTQNSTHVIYQLYYVPGSQFAAPGHNIKVQLNNNTWYDADTSTHPDTIIDNGTTVTGTRTDNTNQNPLFVFTKPSSVVSGPTVTSITADKIFVPSDTVTNTDFTLLKNGSAYANTNISVTLGNFDPVDQPRFYDYSITLDGTASYRATIDSKSYEEFYYDDSWTSSPTSGRSTNSNRILNVLGTIPANTSIESGGNTLTSVSSNNARTLTYSYTADLSNINLSANTTIEIIFFVEQRLINNAQEIVGVFYEIHTADSIRNAWTSSPVYIIGNQETMTYTQNLMGVATTFSVQDWAYSDEPEGDGYVAPVTTTSNGGGKPNRYPLIMTNLFNRNRSIYSIGMTHKDTWDLFL